MPETGAPPPPPADDFTPWEINAVNTVVITFLVAQNVFGEHDRDDLVNECLWHWFQARSRYARLKNANLRTYLGTVVRNKLRDLLATRTTQKRGGYRKEASLDAPLDAGDGNSDSLGQSIAGPDDTEGTVLNAELIAAVHAWKNALPAKERRFIEQLLGVPSLQGAARALGIPRTTLRRRLQNLARLASDEGLKRFLD